MAINNQVVDIRAYKPSLNKDGRRYKLINVHDPVIDRHVLGMVSLGHSTDELKAVVTAENFKG